MAQKSVEGDKLVAQLVLPKNHICLLFVSFHAAASKMSTMKLVYLSWKISSIISINSCSNSIVLCISHLLVIIATWRSAKTDRKKKHSMNLYPASRVFSLAWLLTFTKSFAWLVCRVVGSMQERNFCSQGTKHFDFHFREAVYRLWFYCTVSKKYNSLHCIPV